MSKNNFIKIFVILFFSLFFSLNKSIGAGFGIVAKVEGEIITQYDLDNRYKLIFWTLKGKGTKINSDQIRAQALSQLIDEEIKRKGALERNIVISSDEVDVLVDKFKMRGYSGKRGLRRYLQKFQIDYGSYYKKLETDVLWQKLIQKEIEPNIRISDFEVNEAVSYIVEDPDRLRFNLSEIFIPVNGKENKKEVKTLAEKLIDEIEQSNNFEDIVKRFSRSSSVNNSGKLGWLDEKDLSENFYDVVEDLEKGELSDPVFVGNDFSGGYYIFKLNDKKKERVVKESEIIRVKSVIYNQKLNMAIKEYFDDLKRTTFVVVEKYND